MISVHRVTPAEWTPLLADAHLTVFNERIVPEDQRMDFVLVAADGQDLLSYVQCREIDGKTLYWGHGGSFPTARGTSKSWSIYQMFTDFCWTLGYTRIFTYIENTNRTMLKFAAKMGYLIVGTRNVNGSVFVEHMLDGA